MSTFGSIVIDGYGFTDAFVAKLSPGGVPVDDQLAPGAEAVSISVSPNPFRSSASIRVKLDAAGIDITGASARIRIYDLRGRLVMSLGEVSMAADDVCVNWDGRDMGGKPCPSGVYIAEFSLRDGRELATRISLLD